VEIKAVPAGRDIYMLTVRGGNLGVSVGEDGVFLIDDQFAPLTDKIRAAIAEISDKPIRFLVNTHWHGDHTGGNENFGKAGVVIVAHENVRERRSVEQFLAAFNDTVPPSPKPALPVITFTEEPMLDGNSKVIPGHGPLSGTAELKAYRDMLAAVADQVRKAVAAGSSREQTIAAKPTAGLRREVGRGLHEAGYVRRHSVRQHDSDVARGKGST
jgi:glyoxylase-like metal-dependent hydrolase (beta-lactamase superfamily II)